MMPGLTEWVVIFLVVLILFGAKRVPEIAKSLGKAVNEFKKTKDGILNESEKVEDSDSGTEDYDKLENEDINEETSKDKKDIS